MEPSLPIEPASELGSSLSPEMDNAQMARQMKLLQEQLAVLQIQAAERKKPWYRERSTLVALGSVIIALFTAAERVIVRVEENTQKQVASLRGMMIELADIQRDFLDIQSRKDSSTDMNAYGRGIALNTKRQLLLQNAGASLRDSAVRDRTSPHVFLSLGYEMMLDGRYRDAEGLFQQSIEAATRDKDELMQVWARRTLGQLYGVRGTRLGERSKLLSKSRQLFADAAKAVESREDDFGHKTWGETLILQAQTEIAFGDPEIGRAAALKARARVEQMYADNPVRASLLALIQQMMSPQASQKIANVSATFPAAATSGSGPHEPGPTSNAPRSVEASFFEIWTPQPGSVSGVEMEVLVDGIAIGRLSNLKGSLQLPVGALTPGPHGFELRHLAFYSIDAAGKAALAASELSCAGAFLVDRSAVRKLWIRATDPRNVACGIQ